VNTARTGCESDVDPIVDNQLHSGLSGSPRLLIKLQRGHSLFAKLDERSATKTQQTHLFAV
jgi:hypothetical protein